MILNTSEAALHLGYKSRTTLQRLLRDGLLEQYKVPRTGHQLLLDTHPPGLPSLRSAVQGLTQIRYDSPLWQQPRQRRPARVAEMTDAELHAYCDEHLSDAALEAAMAPINAWCDSQRAPDWARIAEQLNAYLGDNWPAPPYSADQAATLAMCLSLAEETGGMQ